MADISTIKNEMHTASCSGLLTLKAEADLMVIANPELSSWFTQHVYKEYNRRRFLYCTGGDMVEPYDGGFTPYSYVPV